MFLRNRVVPAHVGKMEAFGVSDLAEARDGPGTARESTRGEPCTKKHIRARFICPRFQVHVTSDTPPVE